MFASLKQFVQTTAFFTGYLVFGSIGTLTSVICFLLSLIFHFEAMRKGAQKFIHGLFAFFVGLIKLTGLLKLDASELDALKGERGIILVANHPGFLDVVFIVSKLSHIFCLMKGNLVHNIVLNGQSRLAGYVSNESGTGIIRACHRRLCEGSNLLIFPEGTRTVGDLNSFKMGFALLSKKGKFPIQTVFIRMNSGYLGKGWPFFKRPPLPIVCSIRLGRRFLPDVKTDAREFGKYIEDYMRQNLCNPQCNPNNVHPCVLHKA